MNALDLAIKNFIKEIVKESTKAISKKFNVSLEEAADVWKNIYIEGVDTKNIKTQIIKSSPKKSPKKEENEEESCSNEKGCIHKLLRGKNVGDSCGQKISSKSQTGMYCVKHLANENKPPKEEKEVAKPSEPKYKIVKNKFGNYTHTLTGLVFKSATEKVIYGKQDDEGVIHDLTEEDIETCKKYKFKFEKEKEEDEE